MRLMRLYLSTKVRKDFISSTSLSLGGPIGESTWSYAINLNWSDAESNIINYATSGKTVGLILTKQFSLFLILKISLGLLIKVLNL